MSTAGDKEPQLPEAAGLIDRTPGVSPAVQRRLTDEGREDKPLEHGDWEAQQAAPAEPLGDVKDDATKQEDRAVLSSHKGDVLDEQPAEAGQIDLLQSHPPESQVSGHSILATALQQLATSAKAAQEASDGEEIAADT